MAQPLDVIVVGNALNSFGFTAFDTISGIGLNTFGLLWGCNDIWASAEPAVTTVWADCAVAVDTLETCLD